MRRSSWLKTIGTGLLLGVSPLLNQQATMSTTFEEDQQLSPLEEHLLSIGNDTTFRNNITLNGLKNEYTAWYEILNREEDETIIYDRNDFSVLEIRPTIFSQTQEEINKEILDSIRTRQTWDYASRLTLDIPFKEEKSQKEIDIALLEQLHLKYTGEKMPDRKSERSIGMRFGKRHVITDAIERMAPYLEHYMETIEEKNLPASLLTIPILESSFNSQAISWAGAVGQFQFMYATARDFGLPMSRLRIGRHRAFDYRKHPIVAFDAFIEYMEGLMEKSEEYPFLAPMKYNTGPNRSYYNNIHSAEEAISVIKERGFAPRSYIAEMMAIGTILQEMVETRDWALLEHEPVDITTIPKQIKPSQIEAELGVHPDVFFALNPQYTKTSKDFYTLSEGMPIVIPRQ